MSLLWLDVTPLFYMQMNMHTIFVHNHMSINHVCCQCLCGSEWEGKMEREWSQERLSESMPAALQWNKIFPIWGKKEKRRNQNSVRVAFVAVATNDSIQGHLCKKTCICGTSQLMCSKVIRSHVPRANHLWLGYSGLMLIPPGQVWTRSLRLVLKKKYIYIYLHYKMFPRVDKSRVYQCHTGKGLPEELLYILQLPCCLFF